MWFCFPIDTDLVLSSHLSPLARQLPASSPGSLLLCQHPHRLTASMLAPLAHSAHSASHLIEQELDCVMPCLGPSLDANSSWLCHLWPTTGLFYKSVSSASLWLLNEPCLSQLKVRVPTIPSTQTALLRGLCLAPAIKSGLSSYLPSLQRGLLSPHPLIEAACAHSPLMVTTQHLPEASCCTVASTATQSLNFSQLTSF